MNIVRIASTIRTPATDIANFLSVTGESGTVYMRDLATSEFLDNYDVNLGYIVYINSRSG